MPRNADSWLHDRGRWAYTKFTWFKNVTKRESVLTAALERRAGFLRARAGTLAERRERALDKLSNQRFMLEVELEAHPDRADKIRKKLSEAEISEHFCEILEAILKELTSRERRPRTLRQIARGFYTKGDVAALREEKNFNSRVRKLRVAKNTIAQWLYRLEAIARQLYPEDYKPTLQPTAKSFGVDEATKRRVAARLSKRPPSTKK